MRGRLMILDNFKRDDVHCSVCHGSKTGTRAPCSSNYIYDPGWQVGEALDVQERTCRIIVLRYAIIARHSKE